MFIAFLLLMLSFYGVQVFFGREEDPVTWVAIIVVSQLSILSHMNIYKRGLFFEMSMFVISYVGCLLAVYGYEYSEYYTLFTSFFIVLVVNFIVFFPKKFGLFQEIQKKSELERLSVIRIFMGAIVSAPFFLMFCMSVVLYYDGWSAVYLYFFGFAYGLSYLLSKRVAGLYMPINESS